MIQVDPQNIFNSLEQNPKFKQIDRYKKTYRKFLSKFKVGREEGLKVFLGYLLGEFGITGEDISEYEDKHPYRDAMVAFTNRLVGIFEPLLNISTRAFNEIGNEKYEPFAFFEFKNRFISDMYRAFTDLNARDDKLVVKSVENVATEIISEIEGYSFMLYVLFGEKDRFFEDECLDLTRRKLEFIREMTNKAKNKGVSG